MLDQRTKKCPNSDSCFGAFYTQDWLVWLVWAFYSSDQPEVNAGAVLYSVMSNFIIILGFKAHWINSKTKLIEIPKLYKQDNILTYRSIYKLPYFKYLQSFFILDFQPAMATGTIISSRPCLKLI